jgi:hypothetical protein
LLRTKDWALGEELFAESKKNNSRRRKKLSVKNSSPRAKKLTLGEEFSRLSAKAFFKNHFFTSQIFLSSKCTYTKDMFKFDVILSLFAIFKNMASF